MGVLNDRYSMAVWLPALWFWSVIHPVAFVPSTAEMLSRATLMGSVSFWSAPTLPSQSCIAAPFGKPVFTVANAGFCGSLRSFHVPKLWNGVGGPAGYFV